jgi:hypothetical protein
MAKLIPDAYLRSTSLAGQGERWNAVKISDDPRPLAHLHGIRRTLCGLRARPKPAWWPTPGAAVHGQRCGTCTRLVPADWRPPARPTGQQLGIWRRR